MRRKITNTLLAGMIAVLGCGFWALNAHADDEAEQTDAPKTSLTLSPVSRTLTIASNSTYDGTMNVTNDGSGEMKIEVHASPYSYIYSSEDDLYKLGFSSQTNFTQISRWITIKDAEGNYVKNPTFKIPAGETLVVEYKITTPDNIPAGGQYAVIFAQTISDDAASSGIRTEASAGMVVYGHSTEGEVQLTAEIRDMEIGQGTSTDDSVKNNNFYGKAKVKNTGNVDFFARGKLKVEPIIGFSSYETADNASAPSIIPESERVVEDEWTETPDFGLFKVTWTVTAGETTETIERVVFLISPAAIIITIFVLTIVIVSIIIGVRKRKERRSRLAI